MPPRRKLDRDIREDYIIPDEGFVRQPIVLNVLGISRTTLWRRIDEGAFPRPIKLSPRTSVWKAKDIRAYIHSFDESGIPIGKTV